MRNALSIRKSAGDVLVYLVLLLLAAALVIFPKESSSAAKSGIELCAGVIIPSLFPFFVFSALVIRLGTAQKLSRLFERFMRPLFGVGGACAPALILGFIGGYPVGAKTVVSLYENGNCSREEAEHLLSFCNNSGPAFILGVVGAGLLGSASAGLLLYGIHIVSAVIVGILLRSRGKSPALAHLRKPPPPEPFPQAFVSSVRTSFDAVLGVCGFVIFFAVLIRLLDISGVIPTLAALLANALGFLGLTAQRVKQLLMGFLEISSGVWSLYGDKSGLIGIASSASFMLGWSGLSVHCQTLSVLGGSSLSARKYILGKALQGLFSALLTTILYPLLYRRAAPTLSMPPAAATLLPGASDFLIFLPALAVLVIFLYIRLFCRKQ